MIESTKDQIRARGFRVTPQRMAIMYILQQAGSHLTPTEIAERMNQTLPGVNDATVYRTLNFLSEQGFILPAHIGGGQLVYEIAGHDHHHLICRVCGRSHEIDHELLIDLYKEFEERTGFRIDNVHTTFFGLCPDCAE